MLDGSNRVKIFHMTIDRLEEVMIIDVFELIFKIKKKKKTPAHSAGTMLVCIKTIIRAGQSTIIRAGQSSSFAFSPTLLFFGSFMVFFAFFHCKSFFLIILILFVFSVFVFLLFAIFLCIFCCAYCDLWVLVSLS